MNRRELKVRETMARVARVRDQRAGSELSQALANERQQKAVCDGLTSARNDVREAGQHCLAAAQGIDLGRYALLADLHGALDGQLNAAETSLASLVSEREIRTQGRLKTKSRCERAVDEVSRYRGAMDHEFEKKQAEQSVELWLQSGASDD
jgi:hypothetical protein